MTNPIKRTATIATLAAILIGTVLSAQVQAQVIRPAPKPSYGNVGDAFCNKNQGAANMAGNLKSAGYLDTFKYRYYDNGLKAQAFGVKARDQWFAFTVDVCSGQILEQQKLKNGRPPFI